MSTLPRTGLNATGDLLWLAIALIIVLCGGCRNEETWDTDAIVKVNGRSIARTAVERVLEWGLYPDLDQGGEREINIPIILDKLINEELILEEAGKAGLVISSAEIDESLGDLESAWFGVNPPGSERSEMRQALIRHMLLRKMTERVMGEKRVLSAEKWHVFWEEWPKNKAPSFRVRALLLPPTDEEPVWPEELLDLDEVAEFYQQDGSPVVVSQPLWLSGEKLERVVMDELGRSYRQRRLSLPIRMDESWAIYQVLAVDSGPGAAEEFELAKQAFESRAGEEAFQKWLAEIRAAAKIEYAPSLGL